MLIAKEAIDRDLMPQDDQTGEEIFDKKEAEKFFWTAYRKIKPLVKKAAVKEKETLVKTAVININADEMPPEVAELLAKLGLHVPKTEDKEAVETSPEPKTQSDNA